MSAWEFFFVALYVRYVLCGLLPGAETVAMAFEDSFCCAVARVFICPLFFCAGSYFFCKDI